MSKALPHWWRGAKLGIMITWGAYSVPAFAVPGDSFYAFAEWYWFYQQIAPETLQRRVPGLLGGLSPTEWPHNEEHRRRYGAAVTYDDLARQWLTPEWSPSSWIRLIEKSGARYFVLVAKHHDGIALWPTETSDRHTVALGPRRDIVGELFAAAELSELHTGLCYALAEWFNPAPRPLVLADTTVPLFDFAFNTIRCPTDTTGRRTPYTGYRAIHDYATDHVLPQLTELIEGYQPEILWGDTPGSAEYYRSEQLLDRFRSMVQREHPAGGVVNDRLGLGVGGDFHTYEVGHSPAEGHTHAFEACMSLSTSFGYNAVETREDHRSIREIIERFIEVVTAGGNLLLNLGPAADGSIPQRQEELLLGIGSWLHENGEAIYNSRPWLAPQGDVRFTQGRNGVGYAICPPQPSGEVRLRLPPGCMQALSGDPVSQRLDGIETVVFLPGVARYRDPGQLPFVLRFEMTP